MINNEMPSPFSWNCFGLHSIYNLLTIIFNHLQHYSINNAVVLGNICLSNLLTYSYWTWHGNCVVSDFKLWVHSQSEMKLKNLIKFPITPTPPPTVTHTRCWPVCLHESKQLTPSFLWHILHSFCSFDNNDRAVLYSFSSTFFKCPCHILANTTSNSV
jgi:hypothetical protein